MPDSPTPEPESDFVCDCKRSVRSACAAEPFYKEHESKRYCVLHFPSKEKSADFEKALQRKLDNKDFNFRGAWFPEDGSFVEFDFSAKADFHSVTFSEKADFSHATFSAEADFSSATFNANASFSSATFSARADFSYATFSAAAANFRYATFSAKAFFGGATFTGKADFVYATFSAKANFGSATFSAEAFFGSATFSAEAFFGSATFSADADFRLAIFADHVNFGGREEEGGNPILTSSLVLQFARIEKPEHVSFHTLTLRPHWFVNIDARRFDFTNVNWGGRNVNEEIQSLKNKGGASPHRFLAIACRHLAVNSEENNRYEEASKFRYMAMDARRLESWRGFAPWRLSWWYWLASGYGERIFRAFVVLLGIWFVAGLLYTRVGFARWEPRLVNETDAITASRDTIGAPLNFRRALTYSAGVLTFQRPEPRPATTAAQTVVLLETILGPVQAALLALAIRRKFMR
jgi:hypothetical protein